MSFSSRKILLRFSIGCLNQNRRKIRANCTLDVEAITAKNRHQMHQIHSAATSKLEDPNSILADLSRQTLYCVQIDLLVIVIEEVAYPKPGSGPRIFQDRILRCVLPEKRISFH